MFATLMRAVNGPARFRAAVVIRCMSSGDSQLPSWGSGVGKGGGAGGTVRESGGAFGVREAVMEEQYFRRLTAQQLEQLHDHYVEEIRYLQEQLKEQQETIEVKKKRLRQLLEATKPPPQ
jgi:hypothetical protein